jgi:putative DNA primase/helicase
MAMLGHRACVLGLSDIENSQFALTNLPGKTLAISTEQPSHFIKSPHILNAIISGEPVNVNRKYRDQITVIPRCKLLWAMNELPRIDERGSGLFRRIKLVHFPAIPAERRDPAVKETIAQSGMAITNWALAGLDRLQKRGRFEIPASIADATESYRVTNDIPQLFLDDCTERLQGERTQSSSLYAAYCAWCGANGHRATSSTRFSDEMTRLGLTKFKYGTVYWQDVKLVAVPESADSVIDSYIAEEKGSSN